jgi:hypothetical protein
MLIAAYRSSDIATPSPADLRPVACVATLKATWRSNVAATEGGSVDNHY